MKLNKYVWLSLCASLFAYGAQATEVYSNNDGDSLTVSGYIDINAGNRGGNSSNPDHDKFSMYDNSSRFNVGGKKTINQDIKAVSLFEWGFNPIATADSDGDFIHNRLGYAGIESDKYGDALVGRQWSVYYDIAGWTDMYAATGGEALGVYEYDDGGFTGRGRADDAISYRKSFSGLTIGLQAQGYNTGEMGAATADLVRDGGIGGSLTYQLTDTLKIGASYYYTNLTQTTTTPVANSDLDQQAAIVGINYQGSIFGAAVNASSLNNAYRYGEKSTAFETYLTAKYDANGSLVYLGNNTMFGNMSDGTNNTDMNYIAIGFTHMLVKDQSFYVYGEYRYDLRSDEEITKAGNMDTGAVSSDYIGENMSQYRLGLRYIF